MYFKTQMMYVFIIWKFIELHILTFLTYKYRFVSCNDFGIDKNPKKCIV